MTRRDFWYNSEAKEAGLPPTGCKTSGFIWLSAQVAIDLDTGVITKYLEDLPKEGYEQLRKGSLIYDVARSPYRAQTWRIYNNLQKILLQQGASLEDIIRQRIYLRDVEATQPVEEVMLTFFQDYKPATSIWRMNDRGLNDNILVQVDAFAVDSEKRSQKKTVYIPELAKISSPYPQAVKVGQFLFSSAFYGINPANGQIPLCRADLSKDIPQIWSNNFYSDSCAEASKAQMAQLINNVVLLITSQGATMEDVTHIHQWMGKERMAFKAVIGIRNMHWSDPNNSPTPTGFLMRNITCDPRLEWGIDIIALLPGPIKKDIAVVQDRLLGYDFPSHCKMGPLWVMGGEIPGEMSTRKGVVDFSQLPDAGRFLAQNRIHPHNTMVQAWFLYQTVLKRVLGEANLDFSNVVMQYIFMRDVSHYPDVETIAHLAFDGKIPPTCVIGVDDPTAVGKEAMIEIEFICDTT